MENAKNDKRHRALADKFFPPHDYPTACGMLEADSALKYIHLVGSVLYSQVGRPPVRTVHFFSPHFALLAEAP